MTRGSERARGGWTLRALLLPSLVVAAILLGACDDDSPSALEPAGPGARQIESLWWLIFWIATVVFAVVVGFLLVAVVRARRRDVDVSTRNRWGEPFILVAGVIVPSAILIGVLTLSLGDLREVGRNEESANLEIQVIAHDWWWEARYPNGAVTANEIHIPVGQTVRLQLETADVIHSFWVPRLQAKTDMITGRVNSMWLRADEPGRYRGQCAEYCGLQHANMGFYVVADPPERFTTWLDQIAQPAVAQSAEAKQGRQVFLESTCVGCHAIQGTAADATVGPDLTHVGDRDTLFAGTVVNNADNLAAIITDPQGTKPGVAMPPTELSPDELNALVAYLEQLD